MVFTMVRSIVIRWKFSQGTLLGTEAFMLVLKSPVVLLGLLLAKYQLE